MTIKATKDGSLIVKGHGGTLLEIGEEYTLHPEVEAEIVNLKFAEYLEEPEAEAEEAPKPTAQDMADKLKEGDTLGGKKGMTAAENKMLEAEENKTTTATKKRVAKTST